MDPSTLRPMTGLSPQGSWQSKVPVSLKNIWAGNAYYHDYPYSILSQGLPVLGDGKEEDYAWLAEINTPDDLYMDTHRSLFIMYWPPFSFKLFVTPKMEGIVCRDYSF